MKKDEFATASDELHGTNKPLIHNPLHEETYPRALKWIVSPLLKPFNCEAVPDPDEFWVCFWELIRGHYILRKELGILHGDISIHNMVIQTAPVRKVMLIDFDLAEVAREDIPFSSRHRTQRTGLQPFMSERLLHVLNADYPLARTYRDDLESFFYCLLWLILKDGFPADSRTGRPADIWAKRSLLIDAVREATDPCPALWPEFDQFRVVIDNWRELTLEIRLRAFAKVAGSKQLLIKRLIDALGDAKQYPLDDSMSWAE
ncbi:hypothetical protein CYLTODRAFT_494032 [Cylindrobasidium torrendii FP15055 ss-10]|uniref:Protein kinase domain-containing protein n=1 Tax=Cylindrobasidium torrendii FP15055 ss-10 TaxID=1314674 RepID=A0A0D7AYI8_9AGAR|nr:hypothetical protein CYLTODRAFT_494032 [Cylindrobasidium torrendii FP15055 ss-10]